MAYDGGKGGAGVAQQIINQIPPHEVYIEPFLGNGTIMRTKRPAARSIGVELDSVVLSERWRGNELPGLELVCADALGYLASFPWRGGEFVYADPPYLFAARSSSRRLYRCEFGTIEEHRALLALLRTLPCSIAISGYASWLYELELAGWRSIQIPTVRRSGRPAVEWVWFNYPEPLELHDYQYLGGTFRERERIRRKRQRWTDRLRTMPALERHALMAAIEDVRREGARDLTAGSGDAGRAGAPLARSGDAAGG